MALLGRWNWWSPRPLDAPARRASASARSRRPERRRRRPASTAAEDAAARVHRGGERGRDRGRAVPPAEQQLVEGRERDARDRAVLDRARPGLAAVALRQAGPVGEVVARSRPRGTRSSGGRARPARRRDRTAPAARAATKTRSGVMRDPALHRGAREQVDDRLALDRDAVGGEVLASSARVAGTRAAISSTARSACASLTPSCRSRRTLRRLHPRREQRVQPLEVVAPARDAASRASAT